MDKAETLASSYLNVEPSRRPGFCEKIMVESLMKMKTNSSIPNKLSNMKVVLSRLLTIALETEKYEECQFYQDMIKTIDDANDKLRKKKETGIYS